MKAVALSLVAMLALIGCRGPDNQEAQTVELIDPFLTVPNLHFARAENTKNGVMIIAVGAAEGPGYHSAALQKINDAPLQLRFTMLPPDENSITLGPAQRLSASYFIANPELESLGNAEIISRDRNIRLRLR